MWFLETSLILCPDELQKYALQTFRSTVVIDLELNCKRGGAQEEEANWNIMNAGGGCLCKFMRGIHIKGQWRQYADANSWCSDTSTLCNHYRSVQRALTVSRPAGVTLWALSRVGGGGGRHAGAPDEAERCQAAGGETAAAEAGGAKAGLAHFGHQRSGGHGLWLGCCWGCCWHWSRRRSEMGENLIF